MHLFTKGVLLALAIGLTQLLASDRALGEDSSVATTFARIKPSLALIVSTSSKATSAGTGFCISSNSDHSWFLTNKHVVTGETTYLKLSDGGIYSATVVRRSTFPLDAAIVVISRGNLPFLTLSSSLPSPGTQIAVAGFPSVHLSDTQPSIHLGSINSIDADGLLLEHDALTDHGNSGGPVFDQSSGIVYGINTFGVASKTMSTVTNYFSMSTVKTLPFIENAHVTYNAETLASASQSGASTQDVLKDTSGAYRIGYAATPASQAGAQTTKARLDSYLIYQVQQYIQGTVLPVLLTDSGEKATRSLCDEQHMNALAIANYDWSSDNQGASSKYTAHVQFGVTDCFGDLIYKGQGESDLVGPSSQYSELYYKAAEKAAAEAVAQVSQQISAEPTVAVNLVRYGIAIGSGKRSAGFGVTAGSSGAIVTYLTAYGTAAAAGLQKLDVVKSINGHDLSNMQQIDLNTLLEQIERAGGNYNLEVKAADGNIAKITFSSLDIRRYLVREERTP